MKFNSCIALICSSILVEIFLRLNCAWDSRNIGQTRRKFSSGIGEYVRAIDKYNIVSFIRIQQLCFAKHVVDNTHNFHENNV